MSSASPLAPTYQGHIASTQDALLLFEACLTGMLNHVARRPHDRERANLIKSGNVFIYEEHSSGIKRWTDGVPWSPSRILGNFLVYRELERPFPPGEKKRAMKRSSRRSPGVSKHDGYSNGSSMSNGYNQAASAASAFESSPSSSMSKETERALIGSLVDSYGFKDEGLVKKTVSVTVGNVQHHLVSYYNVADVVNRKLNSPSKDARFANVQPRGDLITKQNFRTPIDEIEPLERPEDRNPYGGSFAYPRNTYDLTNQSMGHRQMALPAPQVGYGTTSGMYGHYGMNSSNAPYENMSAPHANPPYNTQYATSQSVPYSQAGMKQEPYSPHAYRHTPQQSQQPQPPQVPQQQQRYSSIDGISGDGGRTGMPPVGSLLARRASTAFEGPIESPIGPGASGSIESKIPGDSTYSGAGQTYFGIRDEEQNQQHQHLRSLPNPGHPGNFDRPPTTSSYTLGSHQEQRDGNWYGATNSGHPTYLNSQPAWHGGQS